MDYYLLPQPKYAKVESNAIGITLSSLWTIYVNKFRIKDNALLLSSKFNKHFNTFLNAIPIRDSTLEEKWGEKYFFALITSETQYESTIKQVLNEFLERTSEKFKKILNDCCFDLHPNKYLSSLPLKESYFVEISNGTVLILSSSRRGFYYGIQTFIQVIENCLFQTEKFEDYITIPKFTLVDFPDKNTRGIKLDLNEHKPNIEKLMATIPLYAKYKINQLVFSSTNDFPYSIDEKNKISDLCNFHRIESTFSKLPNTEKMDTPTHIEVKSNPKFMVPDYRQTLESISSCNNPSGALLITSNKMGFPLDLITIGIPFFSESMWNSRQLTPEKWSYCMLGTQVTLFEQKLTDNKNSLEWIFDKTSMTESSSMVQAEIQRQKKKSFENNHLLDALDQGFSTIRTD